MNEADGLEKQLQALRTAALAVLKIECDRVNTDPDLEPYDPIANPSQFDERIVALAWALETSDAANPVSKPLTQAETDQQK